MKFIIIPMRKHITKHSKVSLRLFLIGLAMGTADVVPGVSGGTIAFIFGIFEELVYSIKKISGEVLKLVFRLQIKKAITEAPIFFLVPLALGIFTAFATMSGIISELLVSQAVYLWSFFFGLLVASIMIVRKRVVTWDLHDYLILSLSALFSFFLVGSLPVETPATVFAFFISGMIAICAMILPGISGSFLLILMGKYSQVLDAVVNRDLVVIFAVFSGAVLGLAVFSRFLSWLFAKHHDIIVAGLTGFMIGSLRKVWPWKEVTETRINSHGIEVPLLESNYFPSAFDFQVLFAVMLMGLAITLMYKLESLKVTDEEVEVIDDPMYEKQHKKALQRQRHKMP